MDVKRFLIDLVLQLEDQATSLDGPEIVELMVSHGLAKYYVLTEEQCNEELARQFCKKPGDTGRLWSSEFKEYLGLYHDEPPK